MRRVELKLWGEEPAATTYRIGNAFMHTARLWVLCRTGKEDKRVQMTCIQDGHNAVSGPVSVGDEFAISQDEFRNIVGLHFVKDFEQVELGWAP